MKILAVMGSGRAASRSQVLANEILRGARDAGHEIKEFHLTQINPAGCRGCAACRKQGTDCVIEDGLKEYFAELRDADAVVLSGPNYNSMPAGQMMVFMNRHYCMLNSAKEPRLDHDVRLITVFSQGAPAGYALYEEHYEWYRGCFRSKRLIPAEHFTVGGDSNLAEGRALRQQAYALGRSL